MSDATPVIAEKKAPEQANQRALKKANAILDTIDFTDHEYDEEYEKLVKRRKVTKLGKQADETPLTSAETLALAAAAVRHAFGQWTETMDKHEMAEAATEYAAKVVAMAGQMKASSVDFKPFQLAEDLDEIPISDD